MKKRHIIAKCPCCGVDLRLKIDKKGKPILEKTDMNSPVIVIPEKEGT